MMIENKSPFAVELVQVSKFYGQAVALNEISIQVKQGEFYTLLGPSGCGKTTTLNIVAGFVPVSSGEVYINGRLMKGDPPYRRNVNTVFQNYALFPHLTVADNIGFGPKMHKVAPSIIEKRVEEMLNLISLPGLGKRYPRQLSGGQQQRVALARALINQPDVLLLDEPLGALDLKIRKQLQGELANIQRKVGVTFVYVTHDQEEALALSDRITVMSEGRVVQEGTPTEIYNHPSTRFVAHFIGESNFFNARVKEIFPGEIELEMPGFSNAHVASALKLERGSEVTIMARPERLTCSLKPFDQQDNTTTAQVVEAIFMGMYFRIVARAENGSTIVIHRPPEEDAPEVNDWLEKQVYIRWSSHHGIILLD